MHHTLWVLTGPTACDKTEIGFTVAQKIKGEIISADSMLFYRGMDIGTAKPSLDMRELVPHHFIDIIDPWESYSVGRYVDDVESLIDTADSKDRKFLIVGGSPLYVKGLLMVFSTGLKQIGISVESWKSLRMKKAINTFTIFCKR